MAMEQQQQKSYLERIKFDPKLLKGFVPSWIGNIRIVILLVITIFFLGIISYQSIPRRLNPEIKIPIVTVMTVLPGASPEDVESLLTIPLETQITGLNGIQTMTSTSLDSVSSIVIQFNNNVAQDKAKQDVQAAVDGVTDLPGDAQTPKVKALDFEDRPIWTFTVSGKNEELPSLMRFSETLKKNIENTPKVDRVTVTGFEDQQIDVVVSPEKISAYGISPLTLSQLVKSSITSYPAGSVYTGSNSFSLTIDPQAQSIDDLRKLRININGNYVSLGDIATISEKSKNNQSLSYLATNSNPPKRVVTFNVYKVSNANFDEVEKVVKTVIDKTQSDYHNQFTTDTVTNLAEDITDQFTELLGEFRSTILLVMACLFVFLGLRQALISSLTVPLTFLSAFIFAKILGMSINFLTMFAFLIALGLLVDDTIVTVQAMTTYYKTGKFSPFQTGLVVWRDLIVPIWSTTITTIWSFVPLLLASGIIGEFIKPIPVVVTVTMLSSTAIAVLITLPIMIILLKPDIPPRVKTLFKILLGGIFLGIGIFAFQGTRIFGLLMLVYLVSAFVFITVRSKLTGKLKLMIDRNQLLKVLFKKLNHYTDHGMIDLEIVSKKYYWLIKQILASKNARKKVIIGIVIYAVLSFLLLPFGFVKNEFFPKTDADRVYISLSMPTGTTIPVLKTETLKLLDNLRSTPGSYFTIADIGEGLSSMGSFSNSPTNTLFTIHLYPEKSRSFKSYELAEKLRNELKSYKSTGKVSITELTSGPPAGSDLQIKLMGDDLGELNKYADKIMTHLESVPGVTSVDKSIKPGTSRIVFVPDPVKIADAGLSTDAIGLWLRSFASGFTLSSVKFDKDARVKKDVVFMFTGDNLDPASIGTITIGSPKGPVPLLNLGSLVTKANPTSITREDGKRTISVSGGVRPGYSISTLSKDLEKYADSLKLPSGYSWKTGGVNEENAKSVTSILQAMIVAFILILVTMVVQFKSYRQAAIVLMVIPLAVSSVFMVFAITGTPLSFPALIGVLSLFGIVVTNSMFIVDKININTREGMPFVEALADAGSSRLEPIILTKLCTVFGLLPITLSNPLWQGLGGAIISGILIASTIMLLFIPIVYYEWFKGENRSLEG
jgi:HAE1 family hydrophobic/amphiphilic exporter-1